MTAETNPPTRADVLLRESLNMLEPLVRLLIGEGVTYPQFAQSLKRVFLEAAHDELRGEHAKVTDSALSLRSGVHRKDVRALIRGAPGQAAQGQRRTQSVAAEVFARWTNHAQWSDAVGRPLVLPIRGRESDDPARGELSFEALATSISKDFHPRSILEELVRLGVAETVGDSVQVNSNSFVPQDSYAEMVFYLSRNVGDHLATAVANVRSNREVTAPLLENSLSADGLTHASAIALHESARALWNAAFRQMFTEAATRHETDRLADGHGPRHRVRFGSYFLIAPEDAANAAEPEVERKRAEPADTPRDPA